MVHVWSCVSLCTKMCACGCICGNVGIYMGGCVWLNKIPNGNTGQADVSLRGPAEVDGVPVQTDVLQCVPDVVEISQVAECVLVHHLNVIALQ